MTNHYISENTVQIDMKATGKRIHAAMAAYQSATEWADFFELTAPQAIYKWWRGDALPSLPHIVALARFLNTPIDNLIVTEDDGSDGLKCGPRDHESDISSPQFDNKAYLLERADSEYSNAA
ncbi:MAG: hypothetical protein ACI4OA_07080 [Selenomonadaceae bacterium]